MGDSEDVQRGDSRAAVALLLFKNRMWLNGLIATAVITAIVHVLVYPVPGVGIAVPVFVPPVATASAGHTPPVYGRRPVNAMSLVCSSASSRTSTRAP